MNDFNVENYFFMLYEFYVVHTSIYIFYFKKTVPIDA